MSHKNYYKQNTKYSKMLEDQDTSTFEKYVDEVEKFSKPQDKILDIGCGTGVFLAMATPRMKDRFFEGVDVSESSIEVCQKKGLRCCVYDGTKLPFNNESFDIVGSVNVLEHVDDPELYLNEKLRVLRSGGYLILACPNFLSITNNYHAHTRGLIQKVENLTILATKLLSKSHSWQKMQVTVREDFQPDDDACNVTNPIDILKWAKLNNLKLRFWSSQIIYRTGLLATLDKFAITRPFFGSSFMIFKKL